MYRFAIACLLVVGCSSESPKTNPIEELREKARDAAPAAEVKQETVATEPAPVPESTTPVAESETPDAAAPEASTPICALGDGDYCGGNGVPGNPSELFHCSGGVPSLVTTCDGECARMPDGINDRCSCALGNGLYCGGNGVNGSVDTLYRCSGNVVTLEKNCADGCSKEPDGINDKCF